VAHAIGLPRRRRSNHVGLEYSARAANAELRFEAMIALTAVVTVLAYSPPPWPMTLSLTEAGVVDVGACFPGQRVTTIAIATARGRGAVRAAVAIPSDSSGPRVPLTPGREGRWSLPSGHLDCVSVTFELAALARPPMSVDWSFDPRDILISPDGEAPRTAIVRVESTPERRLWVPWPATGSATYRVPESAFRLPGHAFVLPSLASRRVEAAGTSVHVTLAHGFSTLDLDGVERWLRRALAAHSALFGDFPRAAWSLAVVPAPPGATGRGSPVVFGTTSRGGGHHIVAWIPADVPASSLPGEWVLVHELFHLAQPWIQESWFAEGLATYYGEVLRARRGDLTPVELWAALLDGFRRGASVGGASPLGDEEQHMMTRRTFWRVYWGGAAIALLADVRLRQRGSSSLDAGIRALATQLELTDACSAMAAMAVATGDDAFTVLAAPALASHELPDVAPTLSALGVREGPGGLTLDDTAPLAAIRRAIERDALAPPP
jgi:hypothetical protein